VLVVYGNSNSYSNSSGKFIKSPASGSSDLIYNNWKSNKTTYKSYNNIIKKLILEELRLEASLSNELSYSKATLCSHTRTCLLRLRKSPS